MDDVIYTYIDGSIVDEKLTTWIAITRQFELLGRVDMKMSGRRVAEFKWLYVRKRRQGIGRRLLENCERSARDAGCESISATIDLGNYDVLPFYQKLGYVVSGEWDEGTLLIAKKL